MPTTDFEFAADDARAVGIGYAPRGILRGTIAIPLRMADGHLVGYIGVPIGTALKLPKTFKF